MKEFYKVLKSDPDISAQINQLREEVKEFSSKFPMPGFDYK